MKKYFFNAIFLLFSITANAEELGAWTCVGYGDGKCVTTDLNNGNLIPGSNLAVITKVIDFFDYAAGPQVKAKWKTGDTAIVCDLQNCVEIQLASSTYWKVKRAAFANPGNIQFKNANSASGSWRVSADVPSSTYQVQVTGYWLDQDWYYNGEYYQTTSTYYITGISVTMINSTLPTDGETYN